MVDEGLSFEERFEDPQEYNEYYHEKRYPNLRYDRNELPEEEFITTKLSIPSFQAKSDSEAYLGWELKVDHMYSCTNYSELKCGIQHLSF